MDIEPTSPEGLEAPTISAPFPFHVKKGFENDGFSKVLYAKLKIKGPQKWTQNGPQNGPQIGPKSIDFGTSKRYLKWTLLDLKMDPKWTNKNKKNIVYSSVL